MIYITIQARTQSTRFPNKIFQELWNEMSVLECMIERIKLAQKEFDEKSEIVILTTGNPADQTIIDFCDKKKVAYFVGDEENVFKRMKDFCKTIVNNQSVIVDLTSDCPVICPMMLRDMIDGFILYKLNYLSNTITRTFPDGFDIQIYNKFVLNKLALQKYGQSHTGWNIINNLSYDLMAANYPAHDTMFYPELGLTIDEPEDLEVIKNIFNHFDTIDFTAYEIIILYKNKPELFEANKNVKRKIPGA